MVIGTWSHLRQFSHGKSIDEIIQLAGEVLSSIRAQAPSTRPICESATCDNASQLVQEPRRSDVLVTPNLFGDILWELATGLLGGLGVAPSGNLGRGRPAVFELAHGSVPDIIGRGVANPLGAILSAAMLLDHLGEEAQARRVREAVAATIAAGVTTVDLGGTANTRQVVEAILVRLAGDGRQPTAEEGRPEV